MRAFLLLLLLAGRGSSAQSPAPGAAEGYVSAGGGVRLFYRLLGAGRDTVVVLHGGPGFTMDYFFDDLAPLARGHALLFYDQRGAGRSSLVSDSSALDGQRFVEDLEALRRHFHLGRLTILGHSWGAALAALYASRVPDHVGQLIIVGGVPLTKQQFLGDFNRLAARRDSGTTRRMRVWMAARVANPGDPAACHAYYVLWFGPFFVDSSALAKSKGDFCAGTPESRRNKIAAVDRFVFASLGDWDWRSSLRPVTARTLIIHGTADVLSGERDWAATLPNARLLALEGVGHFPYLEAPARFFPAINTFLAGGWPAGAPAVTAP
jgi:proline iminopeptidase